MKQPELEVKQIDGAWYYLDAAGTVVKCLNVGQAYPFSEGMAAIRIYDCIGYINRKLQIVVEPKYGWIFWGGGFFKEGLALVKTPAVIPQERYGFINKKGVEVIPLQYDAAYPFTNGLAVVEFGKKYGAINKKGVMVVANRYDEQSRPVFVIQSATNIDRLVSMYKAARQNRRIFVMDIFTANIFTQIGGSIPNPHHFKDIRVFYPWRLTRRIFSDPRDEELMKQFNRYRISRKELGERKDYCILIRDTMLSDLMHIKNLEGAGMIYSLWGGYLKTARIKRMTDYAGRMGMEFVPLHTSGHGGISTLKKIADSCLPEMLIPIHTEIPEQFRQHFKHRVVLAQDGRVIEV
jgi:hypothetical protein